MEKAAVYLEPVKTSHELLHISQQNFARHLKKDHPGKSRGFPSTSCHECLNYIAEISLIEDNLNRGL